MTQRSVPLHIDLQAAPSGFGSARVATPAHRRIVGHYASPLLLGPAPSDGLLEMILHMFTEEEAEFVQHLPPLRPRTTEKVAALARRPPEEARRILDRLAFTKFVLLAYGEPRKYTILPLVPGTFEMALMTADVSSRNEWHRRFAVLFEHLWDEGFLVEYTKRIRSRIRYLPVMQLSKTLNMAWPSDKLEEILEPYGDFAVGACQCRMAMQLVGKGCGRPLENCVVMGPHARHFVDRGLMRRADRKEIVEIKHAAEEAGCVSWMMSDIGGVPRGNSSCSCCGCCCHALRNVTQFNAPASLSTPHFLPVLRKDACILCRKCISACPMGAWSAEEKELRFNRIRCIGCGLCVVACGRMALSLQPVKDASPHRVSWLGAFFDIVPGYLSSALRTWVKRLPM